MKEYYAVMREHDDDLSIHVFDHQIKAESFFESQLDASTVQMHGPFVLGEDMFKGDMLALAKEGSVIVWRGEHV